MPTFIEENLPLLVAIAFLVLVVILIIILRYNVYMSKFFSNKKFRITSTYTLEPSEDKRSFTLTIFNNNVNDSRVIAFGFIYKNHSINYHKSYLKENNLTFDQKVLILSRDCLEITIDALELKTIISDINRSNKRIKSLRAYVSDSTGLTLKTKAKAVTKQLRLLFEYDYMLEKQQKLEIRNQLKSEVKAKKDKKRFEKKMQRKERLEKFRLKVKSIFRSKKKKAWISGLFFLLHLYDLFVFM